MSAIQAVLKSRTGAIRKGNKHQLRLFFLLEASIYDANEMLLGDPRQADQRTQMLPLPHRHSSITRPCCSIERSSAKLLCHVMHFEHSTAAGSCRTRQRVGSSLSRSTRRYAWSSLAISAWYRWRHRRLSLSLSLLLLTKVTHAQYRKQSNSKMAAKGALLELFEKSLYLGMKSIRMFWVVQGSIRWVWTLFWDSQKTRWEWRRTFSLVLGRRWRTSSASWWMSLWERTTRRTRYVYLEHFFRRAESDWEHW